MSFCRFSTDDFNCDLYVYAHCDGGYDIHVAGRKTREGAPPRPEFKEGQKSADFWAESDKWNDENLVPIGLSHDGAFFHCETAKECADKVRELGNMGYRYPAGVPEAIEDDED